MTVLCGATEAQTDKYPFGDISSVIYPCEVPPTWRYWAPVLPKLGRKSKVGGI